MTGDVRGGLEKYVCGGWFVKAGRGGMGYEGGGGGGENATGWGAVKAGKGGVE